MFRLDWMSALAFCIDNHMNLATPENAEEAQNLLNLCNAYHKQFGSFHEAHIGGYRYTYEVSSTNWLWFETGDKTSFTISWNKGEPNNDQGTEFCLSIIEGGSDSEPIGSYFFNDCHCYNTYSSFICQEIQPID